MNYGSYGRVYLTGRRRIINCIFSSYCFKAAEVCSISEVVVNEI